MRFITLVLSFMLTFITSCGTVTSTDCDPIIEICYCCTLYTDVGEYMCIIDNGEYWKEWETLLYNRFESGEFGSSDLVYTNSLCEFFNSSVQHPPQH